MKQNSTVRKRLSAFYGKLTAMRRSSLFAESTTSPKPLSIGGGVNTAAWIWPMPSGSRSWKKRMRS